MVEQLRLVIILVILLGFQFLKEHRLPTTPRCTTWSWTLFFISVKVIFNFTISMSQLPFPTFSHSCSLVVLSLVGVHRVVILLLDFCGMCSVQFSFWPAVVTSICSYRALLQSSWLVILSWLVISEKRCTCIMMEESGTRERISVEDLVDWSCKYVVFPIHCIGAFCRDLVTCYFILQLSLQTALK